MTAMTEEVPEGTATERVSVPLVALGKTPSFCWRIMVGNAAPTTCRRKREKTTRKVKVLSKGQICQFQRLNQTCLKQVSNCWGVDGLAGETTGRKRGGEILTAMIIQWSAWEDG